MSELEKLEATLKELGVPFLREPARIALGYVWDSVILDFDPNDGRFTHMRINGDIVPRGEP
jgi:hypothetical protein